MHWAAKTVDGIRLGNQHLLPIELGRPLKPWDSPLPIQADVGNADDRSHALDLSIEVCVGKKTAYEECYLPPSRPAVHQAVLAVIQLLIKEVFVTGEESRDDADESTEE